MKQKYPNHELTLMAQLYMGEDVALSKVGKATEPIGEMKPIEAEEKKSAKAIPETYGLEQNYPNPFNPETTIRYQLPQDAFVTLKIYNQLGQEIRTLFESRHKAGFHSIQWDGKNNSGESVTSGIYVYRLIAGKFVQSKKMAFIK